jgi:hypothetical protein
MPRPDNQPHVEENRVENRARDETTVGQLVDRARRAGQDDFSWPSEPLNLDAVIQRIGPKRWAELRGRRDALLARLRGEGG